MERKEDAGNAFLDVALGGVVITTIGVLVSLFSGDGLDLGWLGGALFISAVYVIGALRIGVSPLEYLRNVTKRGSSPG